MQIRKNMMIILFLFLISIIGAGCSPDENAKALKDANGKEVVLDNKDKPTLIFFFTGIG
jgi:hypothetical protein